MHQSNRIKCPIKDLLIKHNYKKIKLNDDIILFYIHEYEDFKIGYNVFVKILNYILNNDNELTNNVYNILFDYPTNRPYYYYTHVFNKRVLIHRVFLSLIDSNIIPNEDQMSRFLDINMEDVFHKAYKKGAPCSSSLSNINVLNLLINFPTTFIYLISDNEHMLNNTLLQNKIIYIYIKKCFGDTLYVTNYKCFKDTLCLTNYKLAKEFDKESDIEKLNSVLIDIHKKRYMMFFILKKVFLIKKFNCLNIQIKWNTYKYSMFNDGFYKCKEHFDTLKNELK